MQPFIQTNFKTESSSVIIDLRIADHSVDNIKSAINTYIICIRSKYWSELFKSKVFSRLFTSNLSQIYHSKVDSLQAYDFSVYNIEQIKREIMQSMTQSVEDTILALFEEFSNKYHYYNETSNNIHLYNGWKTNKAWIINKKVIQPYMNAFDKYNGRFKCSDYRIAQKLMDMEKVFNYLDGGETSDHVNLDYRLQTAEKLAQTCKIETKYFQLTFYKKGTCHIEFTNLELLKKFNIFGSRKKGWLPPNYGKSTYKSMTKEEQAVIDDFEGEEEYKKVMSNKDYYINQSFAPLMITG